MTDFQSIAAVFDVCGPTMTTTDENKHVISLGKKLVFRFDENQRLESVSYDNDIIVRKPKDSGKVRVL
jgi:hypothetical protein